MNQLPDYETIESFLNSYHEILKHENIEEQRELVFSNPMDVNLGKKQNQGLQFKAISTLEVNCIGDEGIKENLERKDLFKIQSELIQ